jgi:hypothetical protein
MAVTESAPMAVAKAVAARRRRVNSDFMGTPCGGWATGVVA